MAIRLGVLIILITALLSSLAQAADNCPAVVDGPNQEKNIFSTIKFTFDALRGLPSNCKPTQYKSDEELRTFFKQSGEDKGYAKYKDVIDRSANEFGIPAAYLACTIKRESMFKSNAISIVYDKKTGKEVRASDGFGIAQFTDSTRVTVNKIISGRNPLTKVSYTPQGIVESKWSELYLPKKLSHSDLLTQPENMIAAAALFFREAALEAFGEAESVNLSIEQLKVLSAIYNMGPGNVARFCGRRIEDAESCSIKLQKSANEITRAYIKEVTECALPNH
jgi:hypothetical protein